MTEPKTPAEMDEEELREKEGKLTEIIALMTKQPFVNKAQAKEKVEQTRANQELHKGNTKSVYHITDAGHVATTQGTKAAMEHAEALKAVIELGKYALDLRDSLDRFVGQQVEILERQVKRVRY